MSDAPDSKLNDLMDTITKRIDTFDAQKSADFKTGLAGYLSKRDGLLADYKKQESALKKTWSDQNFQIRGLLDRVNDPAVVSADRVKKVLDVSCEERCDQQCQESALRERQLCAAGVLENTRDVAKATLDAASARLDILTNLAARVSAELKADGKLITDIGSALDSPPVKASALYSFWFKLLPSHRDLMAHPAAADSVGKTEGQLCADRKCDCPHVAANCSPKDEVPQAPPTPVAQIVDADKYGAQLDQAWLDCAAARDAYAAAESAFRAGADDLASFTKRVQDGHKGLDDVIAKALDKLDANGDIPK